MTVAPFAPTDLLVHLPLDAMKHCLPLLLIGFLGLTSPALADTDISDPVVALIEAQGYEVIEVRQTWLGRVLITARNNAYLREIVLNRTTGQILRDQLFAQATAKASETPEPTQDQIEDQLTDSVTGAAPGVSGTVGGAVSGAADGVAGGIGGGVGID